MTKHITLICVIKLFSGLYRIRRGNNMIVIMTMIVIISEKLLAKGNFCPINSEVDLKLRILLIPLKTKMANKHDKKNLRAISLILIVIY